jgi:MoaA/NifB/PqqE/SkfB family radical SAM enzyme
LTVVKRQNAGHIFSFVRYVQDHFKPNYHSVGFVRGNVDEAEKDFDVKILRAELDELYPEPYAIRDLPVFGRIAPATAAVFKETLLTCERDDTQRQFHCLAGRKMVVLTSDGKLMPCEPLWLEPNVRKGRRQEDFILADLREFQFEAGSPLQSPQALQVKEFISRKECWCAYGCAIYNSILYSPCNYPRILRRMLF